MVWGPRTVACFGYLALRRVGGLIKQELEENMKDTAAVTTKSIDNIEKRRKVRMSRGASLSTDFPAS